MPAPPRPTPEGVSRWHRLLRGAARQRRRLLGAAILLALLGAAAYPAGVALWAEYQFRAAEADIDRGAFAQAEARLRRCLELRPSSGATQFLLARTARRAGDYRQAEEALTACRQQQGHSDALALERLLLRVGQGDAGAAEEARFLAQQSPDQPDAPLIQEALAEQFVRLGRPAEAMECLNRLLERQPAHYRGLVLRGRVWETLKQDDDALRDYQEAVAVNAGGTDARLGLARTLDRLGRPREAAAQYEGVRRSRPHDPEALLGLARCRYDAGELEGAEQLLDDLLAGQPENVPALVERGRLAFRRGEVAEAEGWLRRALDVRVADGEDPGLQAVLERGDVYFLLHLYLEAQGKHEAAADCLARMDRLRADRLRAVALTKELEDAPRDPARHCELGTVLLRLGREQQGVLALTTALQYDPHCGPAHAALAEYYERTGQPGRAAEHRRQAPGAGSPPAGAR
jgi:tetratricopeptide (TPR) repeat protein